jgi:hypothetical protein
MFSIIIFIRTVIFMVSLFICVENKMLLIFLIEFIVSLISKITGVFN